MTGVTRPDLERAGFTALALLVGIASAGLLTAGSWPLRTMSWDAFILLDGAWRLRHGQVPHVDYSSPVGLFPQSVIALGMALFGPGARALAQGPALLLPIIFLASWWIGRARLPAGMALLFGAMTTFLWVGPFPHGMLPWWTSYAMYYNRIGWSLFMLLALECALPPREAGTRRQRAMSGAAAGVLTALLFMTKANYFVAAAALLAASFGFHPGERPARLASTTAGFLLTLATARAVHGFDPLALLADTDRLAACFQLADYARGLVTLASLFVGLWVFMGVWAGVLVASRRRPPGERLLVLFPPLAITAAGTLLLLANATRSSVPLFGLVFLCLGESLRRSRWDEELTWARTALRVVTSITILAGGSAAALDYGGWVAAAGWKQLHASALPAFHRVPTSTLDDLVFRSLPVEGSFEKSLYGIFYDLEWVPTTDAVTHAQPLNDGILLVLQKGRVEGTLVTLDFVNPFNIAMGPEPARDVSLFTHLGRTLCPANLPAPEKTLGRATWVMVARGPLLSETGRFLEQSYRPYLVEHFAAFGESRYWTLLGRK